MKTTLEYLLLTQSPALGLLALALLIRFFLLRKSHKVRGTLAMIGAVLCLVGAVALYYFGMLYEHFTIHDFWQIRLPGWVGLGLSAALVLFLSYRSLRAAIAKKQAAKAAAKSEEARLRELEEAKNAAYESGRADAMAVEKVADTVAQMTAEEAGVETPRETVE